MKKYTMLKLSIKILNILDCLKKKFCLLNVVINKKHFNLKIIIFFVLYFENRDYYQRNFEKQTFVSKKTLFKNA